ncbi:hypothetical protein ACTHAM_000237 [Cellulomonas soli]|uniref:hypothetical protein n=1 Tax=Cellulomonas soli TaxID=931535 RepID=UPI003F852C6D
MRHQGKRAAGVAALLAGVLVLAGCTGDDEPDPTASASAAAPEPARDWSRAEIEELVFEGDLGTSTVLGSAEGQVPDLVDVLPARIDVTKVEADEASTVVWFTLVNLQDTDPLLDLAAFNEWRPLATDIRDVAMVDPVAEQRYQPYVGWTSADEDNSLCACASAPLHMSTVGQLLSATFPALDPTTGTISLEVPGFPAIEGLPVTRL